MQQPALRQPDAVSIPNHIASRLWEIDALRGLAIVQMVIFHFMWDLSYFGLTEVNVFATPWQLFARAIGTQFLLLLGVSLTLSATRRTASQPRANSFWRRALLRGSIVFGLGMVITLATYIAMGAAYVRFGILHLLGLAIILATPFVYLRPWLSLLVGGLMIGAGIYLQSLVVSFPWLIWLGVMQRGVTMVDYYPVLPWAGIALLGIAVGRIVYPQGQRRIALPDLALLPPIRGLRLLGRHSLLIYLVHQPVLLGILAGLGYRPG